MTDTDAGHGLVGLSKGVALETATQGITVNCICPGPIRPFAMMVLSGTTTIVDFAIQPDGTSLPATLERWFKKAEGKAVGAACRHAGRAIEEQRKTGTVHVIGPFSPGQGRDLVKSGAVCIAYETVTSARGGLPVALNRATRVPFGSSLVGSTM